MNTEDAAWLAGFYEGEGSVYLCQHKYVVIKVTQKEMSVLRKIQKMVGFGQVYSEYRDKFRVSKWMCTSKKSIVFIRLIYPFMKSNKKKAQIKRVIENAYGFSKII